MIFRVQPNKAVSHDDIRKRLLALDKGQKYKVKILSQKENGVIGSIFFEKELKETSKRLEKLKQQDTELLDGIEKSLHEELLMSYQNQLDILESGFSLQFEDLEIVLIKKDLKISGKNEYDVIHEVRAYATTILFDLLGNDYVMTSCSVEKTR